MSFRQSATNQMKKPACMCMCGFYAHIHNVICSCLMSERIISGDKTDVDDDDNAAKFFANLSLFFILSKTFSCGKLSFDKNQHCMSTYNSIVYLLGFFDLYRAQRAHVHSSRKKAKDSDKTLKTKQKLL